MASPNLNVESALDFMGSLKSSATYDGKKVPEALVTSKASEVSKKPEAFKAPVAQMTPLAQSALEKLEAVSLLKVIYTLVQFFGK